MLLLTLAGLLGVVVVRGEGACPAPAAVEARLRALVPAADSEPHQLWLRSAEGRVDFELRRQDLVLARRSLQARGSCDELAEAVALVAAVWETRSRAEVGMPPLSAASQPNNLAVTVQQRAISVPAAAAPVVEVTGAALGSLAAGDLRPGLLLGLSLRVRDGGFGLAATLTGAPGHEVALPPGQARWSRWAVAVGPRFQLGGERWFGALDGHLAVAVVRTEGRAFSINHSQSGVDVGLGAALQGGVRVGRLSLFAALGLRRWLGRQDLTAGDGSILQPLPGLEVLPCLGASIRLGSGP